MEVTTYIHFAIHVALVIALPPLLLGVINKTKARFAGRVGPPWLQAYYDLFKLRRKGLVLSTTTTWVFRAGPIVALVTALAASLLLPLAGHRAPVAFDGDFVVFAYLLGLGRFFTIAAALDTGSAFEGMGAAREATFSCLAEPAVFFGLLVLAKASDSLSLSEMLGPSISATWGTAGAPLVAILASFLIVLLAENSRIPFDDPNTHLELTMVHEVMVLDHGGPLLGTVVYGAAIKLFLFAALVVGIAAPLGAIDPWLAWPAFVGAMLAVAVLIGVVESVMARLRLPQIPALLLAACLMSAFGVLLLVR
ncbi:MAG TPA: NADH-quinone oxidoreductase subunit H [Kofleriaceae bacterium]|nr:NADH-quinone oxidoreductase subunit H [Kofleriaceae bacterium]